MSAAAIRYRKDREGKRRRVVMYRGYEGYTVRWTQCCSGCSEHEGYTRGPDSGNGCSECGHIGKRRMSDWVPFDKHPDQLDWEQEDRELRAIKAKVRAQGLDVVPEELLRPWRDKWKKHWDQVHA